MSHPFWESKLDHLNIEGSLHDMVKDDLDEVEDQVHVMNFSRVSTDRPKTATASMILEKQPEINVSFSIRF